MKPTVRTAVLFTFCSLFPALLTAQAGWKPDERLTYFWGYSYDPRAACCGDTIHLVWWESYAHEEVYYKRSTNAGESWGAGVLLSIEDDITSTFPIVACADSIVYVFWLEHNYGTLFKKSTDGGSTWSAADSALQGAGYHDIHLLNDTIFLAGARNPGDIIFRKSTDAGISWLPLQVVGYGAYVKEAVNPPFIGYVYQVAGYTQEIMFKRSTDSGIT